MRAIDSRFDEKVIPEPMSGCWLWIGAAGRLGYGNFWIGGKNFQPAHRYAYERAHGPAGPLEIDHLCRNPSCVNPKHLEAVTHKVNVLRGHGISVRNATATHCVNGHEFSIANTYITKRSTRLCRKCRAICESKRKREKRGSYGKRKDA